MAAKEDVVYAGYLSNAVASTVESFGGVLQHAQNLLTYGSAPSAKQFIDFKMSPPGERGAARGTLSVYADLHNAPTVEDARKYIGSLGNKEGMVVTPGSNEKGHGGKAGFHADCEVGVLGAKAGERYMLGFPQTSGMVAYLRANPLKLHKVYDGTTGLGIVVFARRANAMDKPEGLYAPVYVAEEEPLEAFYDYTIKWLEGFLGSIGSSLNGAFKGAFDNLKDTNGICVHYMVLQDHGFGTQTFPDGVANDIVIKTPAAEGEPEPELVRLSHEISDQFDVNALQGRQFRINGQVVDLRPLCPTAQPLLAGGIVAKLPDGSSTTVAVYSNADMKLAIGSGNIQWKLGPLLLPELTIDAGLEAVRFALFNDARFSGAGYGSKGGLVDRAKGVLTPYFLQLLLQAAGIPASGPGAPTTLPWEDLRAFIKKINELDADQKGQGLEFLRLVFGLDYAYLVVDAGRHFPTNPNKTGVNDPVKESKKVMTALPAIWTALAKNLPADYQKVLDDLEAKQEKEAADKAAKAATAKAAKDAKAAQLSLGGGAAGGGAAGRLAHWGQLAPGGGADDGEASGRGAKRKAAVAATQQLAMVDDDLAEFEPKPKPKPKPKPAPKTDAALVAENGRLTARVGALELEVATLRAKLYQAGIEP